jgi:hypothetical protein
MTFLPTAEAPPILDVTKELAGILTSAFERVRATHRHDAQRFLELVRGA